MTSTYAYGLCFMRFYLIQATLALQIEDLLRFDSAKPDQTLVYILTLGVVDSYRHLGIGKGVFIFDTFL